MTAAVITIRHTTTGPAIPKPPIPDLYPTCRDHSSRLVSTLHPMNRMRLLSNSTHPTRHPASSLVYVYGYGYRMNIVVRRIIATHTEKADIE